MRGAQRGQKMKRIPPSDTLSVLGNATDDDDEEKEIFHLGGGSVQVVTTHETWEAKLYESKNNGIPIVANFSAPCKSMVQAYCEIADNHPNIMFLTVDIDSLADLSTAWEVKATPTFHFLQNGERVDKLVGANKQDLLDKVTALC